jgi:hypothetical protein
MKMDKGMLWMLLPAVTAAGLIDILNQIGSFVLDVLNNLLGTTGAPMQEVLFIYILPFLLVFFTFYDFVYLMGFFRKTTSMIIAAIMALFGARFGVYRQVVEMIGTIMGTGTSGSGLWIPMLTFVFVIMAFWWVIGQFLWGYKFAVSINKEFVNIDTGINMLDRIGTRVEKLSENKK